MAIQHFRSRRSQTTPPALAGVGSAAADVAPPGYPLEVVPSAAKDVIAWIAGALDPVDARARADAALEVENARPAPRATVLAAAADAA